MADQKQASMTFYECFLLFSGVGLLSFKSLAWVTLFLVLFCLVMWMKEFTENKFPFSFLGETHMRNYSTALYLPPSLSHSITHPSRSNGFASTSLSLRLQPCEYTVYPGNFSFEVPSFQQRATYVLMAVIK